MPECLQQTLFCFQKSGCYRLNKHPSLTFHWESIPPPHPHPKKRKTVMIALEKSRWKVMQISRLVQCSSQWHKVVAKTLNPRRVNVNHMFVVLQLGRFLSLIPGRRRSRRMEEGKIIYIDDQLHLAENLMALDKICLFIPRLHQNDLVFLNTGKLLLGEESCSTSQTRQTSKRGSHLAQNEENVESKIRK